jgi:hypothetical protein
VFGSGKLRHTIGLVKRFFFARFFNELQMDFRAAREDRDAVMNQGRSGLWRVGMLRNRFPQKLSVAAPIHLLSRISPCRFA